MSEYIDNSTARQEILKGLIRQLHEGKPVEAVKDEFARLLQQVGASEIGAMEQALITEGIPEEEVKRLCDVHVAVFRESLDAQPTPVTVAGHPIDTFRAENRAAEKVLDALDGALEAVRSAPSAANLAMAQKSLARMRQYERHYLRKENILFPYLEKHGFSGPTTVMWAIHDDIRKGWKSLAELLSTGAANDPIQFAAQLDEVWPPTSKAIREMFYKEENILFPTSLEKLSAAEWEAIRTQESEIGYCYTEPISDLETVPVAEEQAKPVVSPTSSAGFLNLDTGTLTVEEINLMLSTLPVELSYVDENDVVRFFSRSQERIFTRTPAVIGRSVEKCHPPASVHRVQRILDDFRAGRRDVAEFWIQMNGIFIHIRYFALRDVNGKYRGALEVVQDITHIRELEGERRLLHEGT